MGIEGKCGRVVKSTGQTSPAAVRLSDTHWGLRSPGGGDAPGDGVGEHRRALRGGLV